jgi:hypothetical protein
MTGQQAVLASTGESFASVAAERALQAEAAAAEPALETIDG